MDLQSVVNNFKTIVTKHYMDFEGRTRRRDFWTYILALMVLSVGISLISAFGGMDGLLPNLLALALLLPNIGVSVRRLHDTNRTGWLLLLGFIPVMGWLALLYFCAEAGEAGTNRYGSDPEAAISGAAVQEVKSGLA